MTNGPEITLLGMDRAELTSLVDGLGEPAYRASQLLDAVYRQRVDSIENISTLPLLLRSKLAGSGLSVGLPRIESRFLSLDGTVRYLIACADGQTVETVWMPEGDGGESEDATETGAIPEGGRGWDRARLRPVLRIQLAASRRRQRLRFGCG